LRTMSPQILILRDAAKTPLLRMRSINPRHPPLRHLRDRDLRAALIIFRCANPFPALPPWISERQQTKGLAMMYFKTNVPTWERIIRAVMGLAVIGWLSLMARRR
jgi:hypothetical protein